MDRVRRSLYGRNHARMGENGDSEPTPFPTYCSIQSNCKPQLQGSTLALVQSSGGKEDVFLAIPTPDHGEDTGV